MTSSRYLQDATATLTSNLSDSPFQAISTSHLQNPFSSWSDILREVDHVAQPTAEPVAMMHDDASADITMAETLPSQSIVTFISTHWHASTRWPSSDLDSFRCTLASPRWILGSSLALAGKEHILRRLTLLANDEYEDDYAEPTADPQYVSPEFVERLNSISTRAERDISSWYEEMDE